MWMYALFGPAAGWLFDVLGVKDFFDSAGTLFPRRQQIRLLGALLADNPTLGTTDVTIFGNYVQGSVATGTHVYDPDTTGLVWNASAVGTGVIWKIGAFTVRKSIRFSNRNAANSVTVQDHLGNTLSVLTFTAGNVYSVEVFFDGTNWNLVDTRIKP